MLKWILRISAAAVLAAAIYLFAMYQIGNRIIDEAIEQQLAQLKQLELQLQQPVENHPSVILSEAKDPEAPENYPNVILSEAKGPEAPKDNSSVILSEAKDLETLENHPSVILSAAKNLEAPTTNPNTITVSQLESVKNKVTPNDKVSIANMVMKKLTSADIQELTNMLSGGLTTEEKQRAKQIAYSRFTQTEVTTIIELYSKYIQ